MLTNEKYGPTTFILQGLTPEEVEESRRQHGDNLLTPPPSKPWWKMLLEKFDDPIIRILLIAAVLAIGVGVIDGTYEEGIGVILAIFLATIVAFVNEYKASQEFDLLNQTNNEEPIEVLRNGLFMTIPKRKLVVGDLVVIETGQEIPADGQVLESISLQVDESKLTGEDRPIAKYAMETTGEDTAKETTYPPDQLLRSTIVTNGHGMMRVTAVGDRTEIGGTAKAIQTIESIETPLSMQLNRLGKLIGLLGLAIAVFIDIALVVKGIITGELNLTFSQWYLFSILVIGVLISLTGVWLPIIYDGLEVIAPQIKNPLKENNIKTWFVMVSTGVIILGIGIGIGYLNNWLTLSMQDLIPLPIASKFLTYFMIAVAIIVVAVPEGLALSVTLSLAYSMRKMTKQNNLVRQMQACETIGAATVICSDKTGTLTCNQMRISETNFPAIPDTNMNTSLETTETGKLLIEAICVNTTANLARNIGQNSSALGNATEGALLLCLEEKGIDYLNQRAKFEVIDQLTFSPERKYMATLGISSLTNNLGLHFKGAPEILLAHCHQILTETGVKNIDAKMRKCLQEELQSYERKGKRTLGFAYIPSPNNYQQGLNIDQHSVDLIWLGFVAITDPIRAEVPPAIAKCHQAGIEVKMITGDSHLTALEIAHEIGILPPEDHTSYLTAIDLRKMDETTALAAIRKAKVIARARPQDKQRIVKLLQQDGEIVAVTGDGTNDAPALKQAQVGLAMGKIGTSIAKEASDIIILDDSFGSIELGVMWGRTLYQNIQKFLLFQLTINVTACAIALLGPFMGINLPLTVTQLLWVNLIMDTFAALALATEAPHERVMELPPRNPKDFIISASMGRNIIGYGSIFLIFLLGFLFNIKKDNIVTNYELSLFFTSFVMVQFWNLFNAKSFGLEESALANLGKNKWFIVIAFTILLGQILIVQFGGKLFRTIPLSWQDWLIIIVSTSMVFIGGEIQRLIARLQISHR